MTTNSKDSAVVRIVGDNADAQKKIAETIATLKKMGDAVNAQSPIAVRAFRSEAEAAQQLLTRLGASDKQMGQLLRTTKMVEGASEAWKDRVGGAAREVSAALYGMARTGEASGRELKELLTGGAEFALQFGAGGPLVAALGIGGLAIFELFKRTRTEIEETRKKFEEEIARMVRASDTIGLQQQLAGIEVGDPSKGQGKGGGFVGSLRDLRARIEETQADIKAKSDKGDLWGVLAAQRELDKLNAKARPLLEQYQFILSQINNIPTKRAGGGPLGDVTVTAQSPEAIQRAEDAASRKRVENMLREEKAAEREAKQLRDLIGAQNEAFDRANPLATSRPSFTRVTASDVGGEVGGQFGAPGFWEQMSAGIEGAVSGVGDFQAALIDLTSSAVMPFGEATAHSLELWVSGSKSGGAAFKQFLGQAIASVAGKEAAMSFAQGIKDIASGLRASADPITAPLAGFYFSAAAKDFAAGAAFAAIGGGAMAMGGGGGGGGGTRGAAFNSGVGSTLADMSKGKGTIQIVGDPYLDTSNVQKMDALADALRSLDGRDIIIQHVVS